MFIIEYIEFVIRRSLNEKEKSIVVELSESYTEDRIKEFFKDKYEVIETQNIIYDLKKALDSNKEIFQSKQRVSKIINDILKDKI